MGQELARRETGIGSWGPGEKSWGRSKRDPGSPVGFAVDDTALEEGSSCGPPPFSAH